MGILDDLAIGQSSPFPGFLNLPDGAVFPPVLPKKDDDTKKSDDARARLAQSLLDANAYGGGATAGVSVPPAPDQSSPAVQYALGNIAPTANPVDTLPLTPAQQQMMAMVGGGTPVPKPITIQPPFGALAPSMPAPAQTAQTSVPMPQPRPATAPVAAAAAPQADEAALPPNATPTQGQSSPVAAPQEPSLLSKIGDKLNQNSNLLIGMGAGFAGAPSIGTGISRGLAGAGAGGQLDTKQNLLNTSNTALLRAFQDAKVPPALAVAALNDPVLRQKVFDNYLGDRKSEIKTVKSKDAFGNETERLVSVNPYDNTSKDISSPGAQAAAASSSASFAPGVTPETFDHTKVGDDYLSQFSPEVQSGVKAYLRGDSLPTGRQQLAQTIKTVAQKYGDDIGVPANDQAYFQRKSFATSLGDTKSGVGLQAKGFQQGLEHAVTLSDKLVAMKNWNGLGAEPIADWSNWVRNLTTSQQDKVRGVTADSQALAGEVGKLYSGASGGGVHERQTTQQLLGNPNMSGPAAAGGLESTIELMEGGLRTLEQRRDELFPGTEKPRGSNFKGDAQEAAIEHIKKNIAILRGQQAAQAGAAPASSAPAAPPSTGKTASGIAWSVQ